MTWKNYWEDDELWGWMQSISKAIEQRLKNEMGDDAMPLRYKKMHGERVTEESILSITRTLKKSNAEAFEWDMKSKQLFIRYKGDILEFDFGEYISITDDVITNSSEVFYDVYLAWNSKNGEIFEKLQSAQNVKEFHLTNGLGYSTGMLEVKTKCDAWYECLFNNAIVIFDDDGEFVEILDVETYGYKTSTILRVNGYEEVMIL